MSRGAEFLPRVAQGTRQEVSQADKTIGGSASEGSDSDDGECLQYLEARQFREP